MINAHTHGGLGNRLKCIASCLKLKKEYKLPINIIWKRVPYVCNCKFTDLFENEMKANISYGNKIIEYPFKPFTCWRLYVSEKDEIPDNFRHIIKKDITGVYLHGDINFTKYIDLEYNRIPHNIKTQYINFFKSLKLNKELQKKVDRFSNTYFNEKTISVHIRRWSYNMSLENKRSKHIKIENFVNEMKKYKNNNFFLATDDEKIKYYLKIIFNKKLIMYTRNDMTNRNSKECMQNDLIELYLLTKNNIFIGSQVSTFTEVAWYLGGCTKNIIII